MIVTAVSAPRPLRGRLYLVYAFFAQHDGNHARNRRLVIDQEYSACVHSISFFAFWFHYIMGSSEQAGHGLPHTIICIPFCYKKYEKLSFHMKVMIYLFR